MEVKKGKKSSSKNQKFAERYPLGLLMAYSFRSIAKQLGISVGVAYKTFLKDVDNLEKTTEEWTRALVIMENERLDHLHRAVGVRLLG